MEASAAESAESAESAASAASSPSIADNPAAARYELHVNGELAGFVDYQRRGAEISLIHTQVEPAFQGEHRATRLARFSLDDARQRGLAVLPYCPYIASWIKKHQDYADLVPAARRAEFGLE
jgi:predicted GNAT family acetyltransferase